MKQQPPNRLSPLMMSLAPLVLFLALAGCSGIRLVADYDEQTDISITAFQRKIETFLTGLERNAGKPETRYEANVKFYDEAKVDLRVARVRAAAIPKNDLTVQQLDLLLDSLVTLEELHKGGIAPQQIAPLRSAFNTSCTAILTLELAKRRGESSNGR